jgi:predicted AlkP superfamily pyrophosphatase or phosphodiesterase
MILHTRTTVLILLDAFRWDYLCPDRTPYLWDLAHTGVYVQQLKPNFGFCERAEIFTGTRPAVNGYLTAFAYGPDHSPFALHKW